MALRVWLPLNGTLENKGLENLTVTNNGATVDASGKIGSCYYFNGSAQYLQFSKSLGNIYSGDFSWTLWIKRTDDTRGVLISEYSSTGASNVALELGTNGRLRIYWNGSPDYYPSNCTIPKDIWTHVAVTKTTNNIKVYINGEYVTESTATLSARPSSSKIRIGDDYRGGTSVSYMGYLNDIRIYDNCLSTKEVHDISKALVLHYKLDFPNTNLLPVASQRASVNGSTSTNEYMNICSTKNIIDTYGLVPYTISFDIKAAVAHSFNLYGDYSTNPKYMFTRKIINVTTE